MPKKGTVNNPDGRPKGSKNERTKQWEALGDFLTKDGADRAKAIMNKLDDEAYLDQYNKLLAYFKPKQTHNINENKEPANVNVVNMSVSHTVDKDGNVKEN